MMERVNNLRDHHFQMKIRRLFRSNGEPNENRSLQSDINKNKIVRDFIDIREKDERYLKVFQLLVV